MTQRMEQGLSRRRLLQGTLLGGLGCLAAPLAFSGRAMAACSNLRAGITKATVVSAAPLHEAARDRLASALSRRTGKQVELEVTVDPELLGGVVAKVGDLVFDGSLRTQLGQLRANLTKEASR